jgi:RNA polymerase sigma factor (TIGR02999 family)
MAPVDAQSLTELIHRAQRGDSDAADALFAATYPQLSRLARARLRGGGRSVILDTGSLVHESYLRFASSGRLRIQDRVHFLRWSCRVMRSIIVDLARRAKAERRGGQTPHVTLTTDLGVSAARGEEEILLVHDALDTLAAADPKLAEVIEMRYFGGMTEDEVAESLGVTDRTVRRYWEKARLLLREALA